MKYMKLVLLLGIIAIVIKMRVSIWNWFGVQTMDNKNGSFDSWTQRTFSDSIFDMEKQSNKKFDDMTLIVTNRENNLKLKIGELELRIYHLEKNISDLKAVNNIKYWVDIARGSDVSRKLLMPQLKRLAFQNHEI